MEQFDVAFGQCTVKDGELILERIDPASQSRWTVLVEGLKSNIKHRPRPVFVFLFVFMALLVVFISLLGYLYLLNPAVAPLVIGLGVGGFLVIVSGIGLSFRRALQNRRAFHTSIANKYSFNDVGRVRLDNIVGVTVIRLSMIIPRVTGYRWLIHFQRDGDELTTHIGFPGYMNKEMASARAVFERQEIPIGDASVP